MIQRMIDISGGIFCYISTVLNWGDIKGDITFFLGTVLTVLTIYNRCKERIDKKKKKKRTKKS